MLFRSADSERTSAPRSAETGPEYDRALLTDRDSPYTYWSRSTQNPAETSSDRIGREYLIALLLARPKPRNDSVTPCKEPFTVDNRLSTGSYWVSNVFPSVEYHFWTARYVHFVHIFEYGSYFSKLYRAYTTCNVQILNERSMTRCVNVTLRRAVVVLTAVFVLGMVISSGMAAGISAADPDDADAGSGPDHSGQSSGDEGSDGHERGADRGDEGNGDADRGRQGNESSDARERGDSREMRHNATVANSTSAVDNSTTPMNVSGNVSRPGQSVREFVHSIDPNCRRGQYVSAYVIDRNPGRDARGVTHDRPDDRSSRSAERSATPSACDNVSGDEENATDAVDRRPSDGIDSENGSDDGTVGDGNVAPPEPGPATGVGDEDGSGTDTGNGTSDNATASDPAEGNTTDSENTTGDDGTTDNETSSENGTTENTTDGETATNETADNETAGNTTTDDGTSESENTTDGETTDNETTDDGDTGGENTTSDDEQSNETTETDEGTANGSTSGTDSTASSTESDDGDTGTAGDSGEEDGSTEDTDGEDGSPTDSPTDGTTESSTSAADETGIGSDNGAAGANGEGQSSEKQLQPMSSVGLVDEILLFLLAVTLLGAHLVRRIGDDG